ncbi:MAG: aspartate aminotransferase family protein [Steroidobacteraceae bacterium]|jgi:4-aminobutyrate aminotransferase-like enzyme
MINSFDPGRSSELPDREQALVARRQRLLGPAYRLFYEHPVHFVRGEGVWLYDADGAAYLDVYNNVPAVGHCHPRVVEAIARQAAQLNIHTRYLHAGILDYSEMLLATFPSELSQVMYTCTGSEANDLAVRVARQFTGGTGFIVTQLAYHGVTDTIAAMSPSLGAHVVLGPHVRTVPAPRSASAVGAGGGAGEDVGRAFASGVEAALEDMARHGIRPAALLVDTIFSSDGVFADPAGFLQPAVDAMRRAGGLFIADEVQPGFGRTGDAMWGFQRHSLVPDIVTLGKPMGNGYPVAALVAKPEVLAPFGSHCRYFNTFGGNPVAMAAARAVLDVIREEQLRERALDTGHYLRRRLTTLAERFEVIGDVRGAGLFIGVELVADRATRSPATRLTAEVVNELRRRRVLISAAGPHANVLKIRPPLPFGRPEADLFLDALEASLAHVQS